MTLHKNLITCLRLYAHGGFGEAGAMLVFWVLGKPKVKRGGQIVIIFNASRPLPRVYIHRHGCHEQPDDWKAKGPYEVKFMADEVMKLIWSEANEYTTNEGIKKFQVAISRFSPRKIYSSFPHFTFDNFFCSDQILDYLGERGCSRC